MKIVILNASDSLSSNEFGTILSEKGFTEADKISAILAEEIKPDIIYSSPYVRALQTIYPFCRQYKKKVNAECCLYPVSRYDNSDFYYQDLCLSSLPNYFHYLHRIINPNYISKVFHSNVSYKESPQLIGNRVFPFLYALKREYESTNKTVLIVSHRDICPYFLKFFNLEMEQIDSDIYLINLTSSHHDPLHIAMSTF